MQYSDIQTAEHIAAILDNAQRHVVRGSTLTSEREYMHYQLVQRIENGELPQVDPVRCQHAHDDFCTIRTKAAFVEACKDRAAELYATANSQRAEKRAAMKAAKDAQILADDKPDWMLPTRAELEQDYEQSTTAEERATTLQILREFDAAVPAGTVAREAIQCEDSTGRKGCFLFVRVNGLREAVSPVFANSAALFDWCKAYGWKDNGDGVTFTRNPVQTYESKQAALDSGDFNHGAMSAAMLESAIRRGEVQIVPAAPEAEPAQNLRGTGWHITPLNHTPGAVAELVLSDQKVGNIVWSTAFVSEGGHLFRVQLGTETHGFNERDSALNWAAHRLAELAGANKAANVAPMIEEYRTAVISTAHMMPRDYDTLAEHAIDVATDNGLFWVHDTPCGAILRFSASHDWQQELTDIGASVLLITTINALESLGFHAAHFDRDADTVTGLDIDPQQVEA